MNYRDAKKVREQNLHLIGTTDAKGFIVGDIIIVPIEKKQQNAFFVTYLSSRNAEIAITPFNILLAGTNLWWIALIGDCCFTTGIVWIIHYVESYFEAFAEGTSPKLNNDDENNDDVINLHD